MGAAEQTENGFDTLVHIRDPKTGRIIKENHYALHVIGGMQLFERSGKYYWPNGDVATREEILDVFPQFQFKPAAAEVVEYKKPISTKAGKPGAKSS